MGGHFLSLGFKRTHSAVCIDWVVDFYLRGVIVGVGNACGFQQGAFTCQAQVFSGQAMLGNFLALFGAWMAAGYMLMGRQLRKKLNTISYTALVYGVAALMLLVVVIIRAEPVFSYSGETYLWLLALGIFPQLLGHSLFNWALKYLSAAYVSLTLLGEPIGTIILALIFLKESPTLLEGVGAGLIMIGIVIGSVDGSGGSVRHDLALHIIQDGLPDGILFELGVSVHKGSWFRVVFN
jgi:drug/metabolite transporter (DMT)-like permease